MRYFKLVMILVNLNGKDNFVSEVFDMCSAYISPPTNLLEVFLRLRGRWVMSAAE